MKKLTLIAVILVFGNILQAQPWMPKRNGPVKLQDAIDNYAKNPSGSFEDEEKESNGVEKEGKNYLFDRWVWFWKEHLDSNGYMVSPVKTFDEWAAYQKKMIVQQAARKTSVTGDTANWSFQGPDHSGGGYGGLGRINTIAFDPVNANTFYIGSAGGGTWKTTDNGATWSALYNSLPNMGVSDIKVNPLNSNTLYVCTGDADGYDEYSIGVIKSYDGGTTWQNTGLTWPSTDYLFARSLLINPKDTSELTLATNEGIYRSTNGGTSWTNIHSGNFEQLLYSSFDTAVIYATDFETSSSQILRSLDGGSTWATVTAFTDVSRLNIAICPSNPAVVKAIATNANSGLEGIYSSSDSGATYTSLFSNSSCTNNLLGFELGLPTTECNGQGWYDLCIAIDPTNSNNVIVGGINNYYSTDGGSTWTIVSQWWSSLPGIVTVHADKHCLAYNPLVAGALYQGCDGGVYETLDPTSTLWNDLTNGLGITQFYRNAVSNGVSFCIGGAQDNGTKMLNSGVATDLTGGDGMTCQIDYADPANTWYTSFPNGSFDRTTDAGTSYTDITSGIPGGAAGDWVTPLILHPTVDNVLLIGYNKIYTSYDMGNTWSAISPAFHSGYNINNIVMPFTKDSFIYAATDDNNIHFSADFGTTWSTISPSFTATISRLAIDPKNENLLWITYNGYNEHKVETYNRATGTWTSYNGTLPNVPVNCIVIDSATDTKYIGTDVAVFYRDTTMADWALYNKKLPAVIVNDLNINYGTNELWAATYGRGMWKTKKYLDSVTHVVVDTTTGVTTILQNTNNGFSIMPNPNHGMFTIHTTNKSLTGQKVTVELLDAKGKIAWKQEASFDSRGDIIITSGIAKGNYICKVSNSKLTVSNKVIVY